MDSKPANGQDTHIFGFRISKAMHAKLEASAAKNFRNLGQEMRYILSQYFAENEEE